MRFARLDMHEVEELRIEGRRARRRPSPRPRRRGARRRAPHDARLRGWRLRRPRVAPRRLGRVDEPERAHRVARADRVRCRSTRALLRKGRNNVVTSVEIADAATGRARHGRRAHLGRSSSPRTGRRCGIVRCGSDIRTTTSTTCRWSAGSTIATVSATARRDGPPRHAAQSVGHPPRRRHRGAGRRRGRARHGRRDHAPTSSCTTSRRTASVRCARPRRCSERVRTATVLRVEVADVGTDRVTAVAVVTVVG